MQQNAESEPKNRGPGGSGSTSKLEATESKVHALESENAKLKETAQYVFQKGTEAADEKNWDGAQQAFQEVVERFPTDPLAEEAKARLEQVADEVLANYVETVDDHLSLNDKSTYEDAAEKLEERIDDCPRCKSASKAKKKLREILSTLKKWPVEIPDVATLKVRYSDLRGKPVRFSSALVKADTYYNCGFDSQARWRSFKFEAGGDQISAYCRKGNEACESLLSSATTSVVSLTDVQLKYPRSNDVCEERQIELVSWKSDR